MIFIDMHVHSTFSDGAYSVEAIARAAKMRRLSLLCLTDHDTTSGLVPFTEACRRCGVNSVCGIELSAEADYTLHILGYRISPGASELEKRLADVRAHRDARNVKICAKLQALGMDIQLKDVEALSGGEVVARPHIARLMVKRGYVSSEGEAFAKYLDSRGSAYVPRVRLLAEECISLIRGAGGLPVLAHPPQTGLNAEELEKLIARLKPMGLWGIESVYPGFSPTQIYDYLALCDKYDLYPTAGSDFHGSANSGIGIGMSVGESFLPWARLGIKI